MKRSILGISIALTAAACESAPASPKIIPPASVAAVATGVPNVWDTRTEMAAWLDNGVSTGPATLVGDGTEAVIRVDVAAGNARLHGPDFDPPLNGVTGARIRYRLLDNGPNESIGVLVYLRPTTLGPNNLYVPELFNDLYK